jgi:adhesin/invasin
MTERRLGVLEMNLSRRRALALMVLVAALMTVQCSEKEGPISPYVDTDPPPYVLTLSAYPARVEPGEQALVAAELLDRDGYPVSGQVITFGTSLGSVQAQATTDEEGVAEVVFWASGSVGSAVITATTDGAISKYVMVQVGAGALSVSPASILADGVSTAILLINLVDDVGDPIAGAAVAFFTDAGTIEGADYVTDVDGHATATLVSAASESDVVASVIAVITYGGSPRQEIAAVTMRGVSVSVSADPGQIPADGISTSAIAAWVRETTSSAPVTYAGVGFRTSLGAIGASAQTDANGIARTSLVSSTSPGVATITATFGGIQESGYVTLGTLKLSVSAAHAKMVAGGGGSQYVVATLLTQSNNPVEGAEIEFSASNGVIAKNATTDDRGRAGVLLTPTSQAATSRVIASFGGVYRDTVDVAFENATINLRAQPVAVTAKPLNTVNVMAYLSFGDGSPVPDSTVVTFTTTQGTIKASAFTASGIATDKLTPNGVADDGVVVRAVCGNSSATTQVVFTPDVPSKVSCRALPDTLAGGGTSFATVVAEVNDVYGNPVEDGTLVTFSVVAGSGLIASTGLTSGGLATARFTPGGGGVARVRATCDQAMADAGIVVLAESPGAIIADPDTAWIAVGEAQDRGQAAITARVYDSSLVPVDDGTEVTFEIIYGPGGGEYLDAASNGYGPVIKETSGGMTSVTVNSGTVAGTLVMQITAGDHVSTAVKIGISAGSPDSIFVTTGDVVAGTDGVYIEAVAALVRDRYMNPVENGTVVYFTLDRSDIGLIDPETVTGGMYPCTELAGTASKGITRACFKFTTPSMTEDYTIIARCGEAESRFYTVVPIVLPATLNMAAIPGSVSGATGGVVQIYASLSDDFALPIQGATISFSLDGIGSVFPAFAVTDDYGSCQTTVMIPSMVEAGSTKVIGKVFMTSLKGEADITITD